MTKNYYKIGEFSKLTGVGIKSLRYYDKINVLKPAYVDAHTGYRYYMPEQMILLNIIKLSLILNLPLKNLQPSQNRKPNLKKFVLDGKIKAKQVLKDAKQTLELTDDILNQISRFNKPRALNEVYYSEIPDRKVLTLPWEKTDTSKNYIGKIAELNKTAKQNDLTILTSQGILYDSVNDKSYVFITVNGNYDGDGLMTFGSATYKCMILNEDRIKDLADVLKSKGADGGYVFCLNTDIYDFCFNRPLHTFEAQCLTSGNRDEAR